MARVKLVAPVGDLRGTLFGLVYSEWKAGVNYIREYQATVLNPNSVRQELMRERLQFYTQEWFNTLTQAQRDGWEEMAQRIGDLEHDPFTSNSILQICPEIGGKMAGVNVYAGFNTRALSAGLAGTNAAPLGEAQPTPPGVSSVAYVSATGTLTVGWGDAATFASGAVAELWLRSRSRVYHKQWETATAMTTNTVVITAANAALGARLAFLAAASQRLLIQMRTVNPSGYASPGGETFPVFASAP